MRSSVNWKRYKKAIDWFATQANQVTVTWHRFVPYLDRFGENSNPQFQDVELPVLVKYNHFRDWPIAKNTETGQVDEESCELYLNKQQLEDLGYLNKHGYFNFNPEMDRFTLNGIRYRAQGDTEAAQGGPNELLQLIILQRVPEESGTPDLDPELE